MFKEFFKKAYKSRKLLSEKEVIDLEKEQTELQSEVKIREHQIDRFRDLILQDPNNRIRYSKRIKVHSDLIEKLKHRLNEIEIKLLDR